MVTLASNEVRERAVATLIRHSVPDESAEQVVEVLLTADLMGEHAHGLICLADNLERIRRGLIDPQALPKVLTDADVLLALDANNGLGPVAAMDATLRTADRARRYGSCWLMLRNANHPGFLGYYSRMFAQRGLLGLVLMGAPEARSALPISSALPGAAEPIWVDANLQSRNLDCQSDTAPPQHAAALNTVISLLSSVANGGAPQREMRSMGDLSGPAQLCLTFIAADSSRLMERDDYVDTLAIHLRSPVDTDGPNQDAMQESAPDLPGETGNQRLIERKESGLIMPAHLWSELDALLAAE